MSNAITAKSLKGLTHKQILAETDHFFAEGSGPECFLLNEQELRLVNELEALEDESAPVSRQRAVLAQIRAVIRSLQILGCTEHVEFPR